MEGIDLFFKILVFVKILSKWRRKKEEFWNLKSTIASSSHLKIEKTNNFTIINNEFWMHQKITSCAAVLLHQKITYISLFVNHFLIFIHMIPYVQLICNTIATKIFPYWQETYLALSWTIRSPICFNTFLLFKVTTAVYCSSTREMCQRH